jgi:hypothetical protein
MAIQPRASHQGNPISTQAAPSDDLNVSWPVSRVPMRPSLWTQGLALDSDAVRQRLAACTVLWAIIDRKTPSPLVDTVQRQGLKVDLGMGRESQRGYSLKILSRVNGFAWSTAGNGAPCHFQTRM